MMDVLSTAQYPASQLSNLAAHPFVFDGVACSSMEGFLQSLKFESPAVQEYVCTMFGIAAKRKGATMSKHWQAVQTLWWAGRAYDRHGEEYEALLTRAYDAMFEQSENFRRALAIAGDEKFEHSVGTDDPSKTVITTAAFCGQLDRLRRRLRNEHWTST